MRPHSCSECGFDFEFDRAALARRCDSFPGTADDLLGLAEKDLVRRRTNPDTWSPIEYAAHVDEAVRWYVGRIGQVLAKEFQQLAPFDFDAAAQDRQYLHRSVATVVDALRVSCSQLKDIARSTSGSQLKRCGVGSDGSPRDVALLLARAHHELVHHEVDLRRGLGLVPMQ